MGCMEDPCFYQAMSKIIIDKSMVGIILCLSVQLHSTLRHRIMPTIDLSIIGLGIAW